jgi:hypothetical protein
VTDPDYAVRHEAGNAIRRLVRTTGGRFTERPLIRSDPDGRKVEEPEPLTGITAAVAVEREVRRLCLESVRYAREDGLTWAQIGEALGFRVTAVDPDDHGTDESLARLAYEYAVPGHAAAGWFTWTCPSCRQLVRDYGPELGPREAEDGHAEDCGRFAATVRAWDAQWDEEDGNDG